MSREYNDDRGNKGAMVTAPEDLRDALLVAHSAGMQVAVHVIGDRALDVSLDAVEFANTYCPRPDPRHRMVHCQIMRPGQFARMSELGCIAAIQPKFVTTDMRWTRARVGRELEETSYAWKRMIEAGVACAGGSDAPVEPIEPLLGLWAAVNRTDMKGSPPGGWLPDQKISVEDAIAMFTGGSAYAEFAEKERGTLTRGALADLVVLDRDPREILPEEIRDMKILQTWVGGRPVHSYR